MSSDISLRSLFCQQRLDAIRQAITNHASNLQDIILEQATQIAELLRPTIISLLNIFNDLGVQIQDLKATIEQTLNLIIGQYTLNATVQVAFDNTSIVSCCR